MFGNKEILQELRIIRGQIQELGVKMAIDTSKLVAADQAILDAVAAIPATVATESAKIQTAIDNLAALESSDPTVQAAIDAEVARLQTVPAALSAVSDSINALPTTPTPPAGQ